MSDIALRPRSATELVDAAFQVFRREPVQFLVAVGLSYAPLLLIIPFLGLSALAEGNLTVWSTERSAIMRNAGVGTVFSLAVGLSYIFASGLTTVIASDVYLGKPADLGRAFAVVARRVPRLAGGLILVAIIMVVPAITVPLVGMLNSILALAAFAFFIFAEAWIYATVVAVRQAILLEDTPVVRAISRSQALADGLRGHILRTTLLVFVINLAFAIGASIVAAMLGNALLRNLLQYGVTIVLYPLVAIVQTLLYYDLRIRQEGFDIEHLASSFDAPPATT